MRQRIQAALVTLCLTACFVAGSVALATAGPYTRLLVLLPGESAAPGTVNGKSGSPLAQTTGVPFTVSVRACDDQWNTVTTIADVIQLFATDASATLPAPAQLQSGVRSFSVTFNAGGTFNIQAHEQTDGTIPDGVSSAVRSLVLQGFTFSRITQKNQNAGAPMTVTLQAVDPGGQVVSGFSGTVRIKEITSYGDGRTSPDSVVLSSGTWTGPVAMFRADETSINRGNVNLFAWLPAAPGKNGTSDPFTVHPGLFARVQIVVPGQNPLPGSISGVTGSPASQAAARSFPVTVYSTDTWWNSVSSGDAVRITSIDPAASTPVSGTLTNGVRSFNVSLGTVGTQTLTVTDQTNGSITGMTTAGIQVLPNAADHFAISTIASPQVAGAPVAVSIRAVDLGGNTIPNYAGDAVVLANTGSGSVTPELITFANGLWSGTMTFRGAGGAVSFTVSDFTAPPHTGGSNSFTVQPGPLAGLQVLLPGESAQGGTLVGKSGTPVGQSAGNPFTLTVRAVDAFWNLVPGVGDSIALGSSDAFAGMPADTTLANGQALIPVRLYRTGAQRLWATDTSRPAVNPDTSSAVQVSGGPFSRLLVLAPGESPAPGTSTGRTGTATAQSINYYFTVTVLATDAWWNPVTGVADVVHLTSTDLTAVLAADTVMTDGRADMRVRLRTGGFQQITVSDVSQPGKTGSSTQVNAITTGFHLEATVSPASVNAGQSFTLSVRATNDAGSVIQEINSLVTVEAQHGVTRAPGRGAIAPATFQLLQGQRTILETYSFAEPIQLVVRDDAGNAPGITGVINITPGPPTAIDLTSSPRWVGGNKKATLSARLMDYYGNGVPAGPMSFQLVSGTGTLVALDVQTDTSGVARADFTSPRVSEHDLIRAISGPITADLDLETALVDPGAAGGYVSNYPNPFHPSTEPTTIAYKLDDDATVTLRIFTQSGDLVRQESFARGAVGGRVGLNEWAWDGRNGRGTVVASGGYLMLIEAQGTGETLHVIRRKIAVVR